MKKIFLILSIFYVNNIFSQQPCVNFCLSFDDTLCHTHLVIDTANTANIWQIGRPQKPLFDSIPSNFSPKAIITDTVNYYPINNNSVFTIWTIADMGDYYGFRSFFGMYNVQTDSLNDYGSIEISPDNGTTWINLLDTAYSASFVWYGSQPVLTGNSNGWQSFEVLLTDLGSTFNIQIGDTLKYRFTFKSDAVSENLGGLMFDYLCFHDFVEGVTETRFKNIKSNVYPNPSNNTFTIDFDNPNSDTYEISVYDIHSKLVFSQDNIVDNRFILNAQLLKQGTYYFKLTNIKDRKRCWGKLVTAF